MANCLPLRLADISYRFLKGFVDAVDGSSREDARRDVFDYPKRKDARKGKLLPVEFEPQQRRTTELGSVIGAPQTLKILEVYRGLQPVR